MTLELWLFTGNVTQVSIHRESLPGYNRQLVRSMCAGSRETCFSLCKLYDTKLRNANVKNVQAYGEVLGNPGNRIRVDDYNGISYSRRSCHTCIDGRIAMTFQLELSSTPYRPTYHWCHMQTCASRSVRFTTCTEEDMYG